MRQESIHKSSFYLRRSNSDSRPGVFFSIVGIPINPLPFPHGEVDLITENTQVMHVPFSCDILSP